MSKLEWKVGEFAKRVSENQLSWMPVGHIGEVTSVDEEDPDQPVCLDYVFWPHITDIERVIP
jgi:hypothetical protein